MENSIINKINSIIIEEERKDETMISLLEYIELIDNLNDEINKKYKEIIKKCNSKLGSNLNFFNYEIKSISVLDNILIKITHELMVEDILIQISPLKIVSNFKDSDIFLELISAEIYELLKYLEDYKYLSKISIKSKYKELNFIIDYKMVEIFMYKSPNWITMGKSFSLKYDFYARSFRYDIDSVNLESNIKKQEKLLFSRVIFKKNILPNDLQVKYEYYKNHVLDKKNYSFFQRMINKVKNIFRKN